MQILFLRSMARPNLLLALHSDIKLASCSQTGGRSTRERNVCFWDSFSKSTYQIKKSSFSENNPIKYSKKEKSVETLYLTANFLRDAK